MGAIKNAIKSFNGADEAKKELENQLDNMTALAKAKVEYFELKLKNDLTDAGAGSDKNIPVKFILSFARQTHAFASSSMDNVASVVTESIDNFISGGQDNVMKGVSSLMTKTIQALFASEEGGEEESHFMSVFAEGQSLVRLDLKAWKRFTNVKSLSESAEQISAFVMCKSTIDADKLDYNTFIQLYQKNLYEKSSGFSTDQAKKQLEEIEAIYQKFMTNQKTVKMSRIAMKTSPHHAPSDIKTKLANASLAVESARKELTLSMRS